MSIYKSIHQLQRQCKPAALGAKSTRMMSIFGFGSSSSDSQSMSTSAATKKESINKRSIIEEVASTHDLSVAKSERIVNTVFDTIVEAVIDGKQARLSNFGSFDSYMSKPRTGRNPSTGEPIDIPSSRRIRFKAYDGFKKAK